METSGDVEIKSEVSSKPEKVVCRICKKEYQVITATHLKTHGMTRQVYMDTYPDAEMGTPYDESKKNNGKGVGNPTWKESSVDEKGAKVDLCYKEILDDFLRSMGEYKFLTKFAKKNAANEKSVFNLYKDVLKLELEIKLAQLQKVTEDNAIPDRTISILTNVPRPELPTMVKKIESHNTATLPVLETDKTSVQIIEGDVVDE